MTLLGRFALPRRTILRGAGGVAVALPFLDAMVRVRRAHAQAPRSRFIVMFNANGTLAESWNPTGTETSFTLSPILSPLAPYQSDLLILQGLDNLAAVASAGGNPHDKGTGCLLTGIGLVPGPSGEGEAGHLWDGTAGGISIDQEMAKHIGTQHKFKSLEFGVQAGGLKMAIPNRVSYLAPFQAVPPENKPEAAFARIFGDLNADPAVIAETRARKQSILDSVKGDLSDMKARLGADDRRKLDAHTGAIRELELRLSSGAGMAGASCSKPAAPAATTDYQAVGRLQMDLLVMALVCDLTRVATLQWSTGQSEIRFSWLGISEGHHAVSHRGDSDATAVSNLMKIQQWYGQQFAYLLGKLKAVQDGPSGTLLDQCAALWANELGRGNSHLLQNLPFVLAGKAGGKLRTGRYLKYVQETNNDLFVALLNVFGVPMTTFGDPRYCKGPLAGLT